MAYLHNKDEQHWNILVLNVCCLYFQRFYYWILEDCGGGQGRGGLWRELIIRMNNHFIRSIWLNEYVVLVLKAFDFVHERVFITWAFYCFRFVCVCFFCGWRRRSCQSGAKMLEYCSRLSVVCGLLLFSFVVILICFSFPLSLSRPLARAFIMSCFDTSD